MYDGHNGKENLEMMRNMLSFPITSLPGEGGNVVKFGMVMDRSTILNLVYYGFLQFHQANGLP